MRIAVGRGGGPTGLGEGTVVRGYAVDAMLDDHVGAELRYLVRGPHGEEATLITARRPPTHRRVRARFRRLASLRVKFAHPAALGAHAFGEHDGQPYLITDAYPDTTFGDVLENQAPLAPERLLALLAPVGDALDRAHAAGLVHQRLEADSLLVCDDGRLALDSFGLLVGGDGPVWSGAQSVDVRYRSPEQALGERPRPESNVYSLAAMIVHALTGAPPFGDHAGAAYAHATEAPPRVTDRVAGLPSAIDDVVAWGMAKQPAERPRSATELLYAVEAALGTRVVEEALGAAPAPHVPKVAQPDAWMPPSTLPPPTRRTPAAALAGAVAVAAACGAIAAVALDPFGGDESPAAPARGSEPALWERVADRRAELRDELAAAATPQEQAAAATELAAVYEGAADLARPSRLSGASRSAAGAYLALAEAAEANDEAAYADASQDVVAAERRIASAPR